MLFSRCPARILHPAKMSIKSEVLGFPGGSVVKNQPANAGDIVSIPDLGRSHMERSS